MDQVNRLPQLVVIRQLGEPGAPCNGSSTCTDNVGRLIVQAETGRLISSATFRQRARPGDPTPCRGLTANQFLRGLLASGVRGYGYHAGVTASQVLAATDRGFVLVGVGYGGWPTPAEAQVGGATDAGFRARNGAHAVAIAGRRRGEAYGAPGRWVCWARDPDHRFSGTDANGRPAPPYDRFETRYLARAMAALTSASTSGGGTWPSTFAIWKA